MQVTDQIVRNVVSRCCPGCANGPGQRPSRNGTSRHGASSPTLTPRSRPPSRRSTSSSARPRGPPQGRRLHPPYLHRPGRAAGPRGIGRNQDRPAQAQDREAANHRRPHSRRRVPAAPKPSAAKTASRLKEYAPFGVIGVITPVTHSLPTLACNAINMLAAGNALVCNPHPSGTRIACKGAQLFNQAIHASDRHRQPDHDHRQADAGIGPGDLRSPRRAPAVRHRRPGGGPGGAAEPQASHRRRAGQSAGRRR